MIICWFDGCSQQHRGRTTNLWCHSQDLFRLVTFRYLPIHGNIEVMYPATHLGFHKVGSNFCWPKLVPHTKGAKPCFTIFSYGEKICFSPERGHGPTAPSNTPLNVPSTNKLFRPHTFGFADAKHRVFSTNLNIVICTLEPHLI